MPVELLLCTVLDRTATWALPSPETPKGGRGGKLNASNRDSMDSTFAFQHGNGKTVISLSFKKWHYF